MFANPENYNHGTGRVSRQLAAFLRTSSLSIAAIMCSTWIAALDHSLSPLRRARGHPEPEVSVLAAFAD